jgi:hypothetical protein
VEEAAAVEVAVLVVEAATAPLHPFDRQILTEVITEVEVGGGRRHRRHHRRPLF